MMCSGRDPYEGQTPAMVIFAQASVGMRGRHTPLRHGSSPCCGLAPAPCQPTGCPACRLLTCCVQVRSSEGGNGERLPPIDGIPAELQQLLWDCTAHDKRDR